MSIIQKIKKAKKPATKTTVSSKQKYNVYKRYIDLSDEGYSSGAHEGWRWMGSTFAVSAEKAMNNVQFRIHGDGGHNHGRYRIVGFSHHTGAMPEWKACVQFSEEDKAIYESIRGK